MSYQCLVSPPPAGSKMCPHYNSEYDSQVRDQWQEAAARYACAPDTTYEDVDRLVAAAWNNPRLGIRDDADAGHFDRRALVLMLHESGSCDISPGKGKEDLSVDMSAATGWPPGTRPDDSVWSIDPPIPEMRVKAQPSEESVVKNDSSWGSAPSPPVIPEPTATPEIHVKVQPSDDSSRWSTWWAFGIAGAGVLVAAMLRER